jgi:hypothetical protein
MRIGHVQHARIAELADSIEIVGFGAEGNGRKNAGKRRRGEQFQYLAAAPCSDLLGKQL